MASEDKIYCPCGCGKFGVPRVRRSRDGLFHTRNCGPCRSCDGRRARNRSSSRERVIAKSIPNGVREVLSGAVSGHDVGCPWLVYEETHNVGLVAGLRRWWEREAVQRKTARILAAELPGAFIASWDGSPRVVVMSWEGHRRLLQIIATLAESAAPCVCVQLEERDTEVPA
jgi:hypothetical protein